MFFRRQRSLIQVSAFFFKFIVLQIIDIHRRDIMNLFGLIVDKIDRRKKAALLRLDSVLVTPG
jgi:hypothetical protein